MAKRLLIVMISLTMGGAERSLVNLLNALPCDKYQVDLLLFRKEGMLLNQVPDNVCIIEAPVALRKLYAPIMRSGKYLPVKLIGTFCSRFIKWGQHQQQWIYRWKNFYSKKIEKVEKKYDAAIAYISGEVMYFIDEKVCAEKKYAWVHNDYSIVAKERKKDDYPYFKRMDRIITISDKCVDVLKQEFPEIEDKFLKIENITSSTIPRQRANEFVPQEFSGNAPIILSIGRLMQQKGFDMAVEAAALMKKDGYRFVWYIIGNGELEEPLRRQIKERHVEDCFRLLGVRENPYPYIKHCTIFAQTSRWEGKSVVIDEAKILAKPLVVTDYATVHDQVSQEVEGLIVPMHAQGIAEGLERMLDDHDLRSRIEDHLQAHEYGNQSEVMKYMKLFDE